MNAEISMKSQQIFDKKRQIFDRCERTFRQRTQPNRHKPTRHTGLAFNNNADYSNNFPNSLNQQSFPKTNSWGLNRNNHENIYVCYAKHGSTRIFQLNIKIFTVTENQKNPD
ncbi:hypothetical protein CVS40_11755 [Lucilia cuprina]|nr:hypothetical protein CVS40_11755 [Lucilia cuprina]